MSSNTSGPSTHKRTVIYTSLFPWEQISPNKIPFMVLFLIYHGRLPSTIIAMWLTLQNGEHSAFAKTQLYRYYITEHPRTPDISPCLKLAGFSQKFLQNSSELSSRKWSYLPLKMATSVSVAMWLTRIIQALSVSDSLHLLWAWRQPMCQLFPVTGNQSQCSIFMSMRNRHIRYISS